MTSSRSSGIRIGLLGVGAALLGLLVSSCSESDKLSARNPCSFPVTVVASSSNNMSVSSIPAFEEAEVLRGHWPSGDRLTVTAAAYVGTASAEFDSEQGKLALALPAEMCSRPRAVPEAVSIVSLSTGRTKPTELHVAGSTQAVEAAARLLPQLAVDVDVMDAGPHGIVAVLWPAHDRRLGVQPVADALVDQDVHDRAWFSCDRRVACRSLEASDDGNLEPVFVTQSQRPNSLVENLFLGFLSLAILALPIWLIVVVARRFARTG